MYVRSLTGLTRRAALMATVGGLSLGPARADEAAPGGLVLRPLEAMSALARSPRAPRRCIDGAYADAVFSLASAGGVRPLPGIVGARGAVRAFSVPHIFVDDERAAADPPQPPGIFRSPFVSLDES